MPGAERANLIGSPLDYATLPLMQPVAARPEDRDQERPPARLLRRRMRAAATPAAVPRVRPARDDARPRRHRPWEVEHTVVTCDDPIPMP